VQNAIAGRTETIALVRPGWNGHGVPQGLQGNAEAAAAELARLGIELATVVGHSFGGAVAAWLAEEHPERVGALVLVAPSANEASVNRLDRVLATPVLGDLLVGPAFAGFGAALRVPAIRRRVADQFSIEEPYLRAAARELVRPASSRAFIAEQRMLIRDLPSLEARLGTISGPTTIVVGSKDRIVSPSSARKLATQIPGAELVELPGATHLLLQHRPTRLAELIVAAGER
jgi:pimeloyl-ACP methyl ester carboxylesterase